MRTGALLLLFGLGLAGCGATPPTATEDAQRADLAAEESSDGATDAEPAEEAVPGATSVSTEPQGDADPGTPLMLVATDPMDFWQVECGAAAVRSLPIANSGSSVLTVRAAAAGPFAVSPPTLAVAPGSSAQLQLTAAVPGTATAGVPIHGTLSLSTNDPAAPSTAIDLAVTPLGATITIGPSVSSPADFGPQAIGLPFAAQDSFYLLNSGNEAAEVTVSAPTDPQFTMATDWLSLETTPIIGSRTVTLDPARALPSAFFFVTYSPTVVGISTASSRIQVSGALCRPSVDEVDFSGEGIAAGLVNWPVPPVLQLTTTCGSAPTTTGFLLSNVGSQPVTIRSLTFDGVGFQSSVDAGTVVTPNALQPLDVVITAPTPPVSPSPATYEGVLRITTDAPGDVEHAISIAVTCTGP